MEKLADTLTRLDVAFEHLIWLPGVTCHACDTLRELLWDDPESVYKALDLPCPEVDENFIADEVLDTFLDQIRDHRKTGFLVQVATPIQSGPRPPSWGYYTTRWLYTERLDDTFIPALEAWVASKNAPNP